MLMSGNGTEAVHKILTDSPAGWADDALTREQLKAALEQFQHALSLAFDARSDVESLSAATAVAFLRF